MVVLHIKTKTRTSTPLKITVDLIIENESRVNESLKNNQFMRQIVEIRFS